MSAMELQGLIDPDWTLEDLDPRTWRAIGPFISPARYMMAGEAGEHALFVLHDAGRVLRVVDSVVGARTDLGVSEVSEPRALAEQLHERGEWARVHVIDRRHLNKVAAEAQASPQRELSLDAYYRRVYGLVWGDPAGYACVPPRPGHWNHWTYAGVADFIAGLPSPSSLALGVIEDGEIAIGLIVRTSEGKVRQVTTFEALPVERPAVAVSGEFAGWLWSALDAIAPPAALLLCTMPVFDAWITQPGKRTVIEAAQADGNAILRERPAS
jgi:hypothetical protein